MLFKQRLLHVHENNVRLDLAVVVVCGFAVAPGVVDLHVLVERVIGNGLGYRVLSLPN